MRYSSQKNNATMLERTDKYLLFVIFRKTVGDDYNLTTIMAVFLVEPLPHLFTGRYHAGKQLDTPLLQLWSLMCDHTFCPDDRPLMMKWAIQASVQHQRAWPPLQTSTSHVHEYNQNRECLVAVLSRRRAEYSSTNSLRETIC